METLIYKDLVPAAPRLNGTRSAGLDWSNKDSSSDQPQFGLIQLLGEEILITFSQKDLFLLDPSRQAIIARCCFTSPIVHAVVCHEQTEIYVLCQSGKIVRIARQPDLAITTPRHRSVKPKLDAVVEKRHLFKQMLGKVKSAADVIWKGVEDNRSVTTLDTAETWSSSGSNRSWDLESVASQEQLIHGDLPAIYRLSEESLPSLRVESDSHASSDNLATSDKHSMGDVNNDVDQQRSRSLADDTGMLLRYLPQKCDTLLNESEVVARFHARYS